MQMKCDRNLSLIQEPLANVIKKHINKKRNSPQRH